MPMKDRKVLPLLATDFSELDAQLSPDGKWLAYISDESGIREIYVRPFQIADDEPKLGPGKWQVSAGGGVHSFWRSDGKELVYITMQSTVMSAMIQSGNDFHFDPPKELFRNPSLYGGGPPRLAMTPDGKRFLAVISDDAATPELTVVLNWWQALGR
jgi:hypothetical protein